MSLVKLNRKKIPWINDVTTHWFNTDDFFTDDFMSRGANLPAMNVKENPKNFEVELAVPGFDKTDIEVSLENDILHVCAKKKQDAVEENENGYTRREFSYNSFDRKLQMPKSVNQKKDVKATYKNGILKLQLAKSDAAVQSSKKLIEIA
ncbi:Hsp20/alpha crystallin family protein [Constantimarinum furrinae]|uniref:Heat-shock protein n=1 Tax=Constantimarinum furrinae TaxID=2562285 RepID=A0A7G8PXL4_9FLAO|nr:Hsp20/alpha crystallin family protein [Constantimarinum furrinae]QNJ99080.1 Heat-shock protein [Constantimarinum furrinae]